jgi:hypothetical protein
MKQLSFRAISGLAGLLAALATRQLVSALWRGDTDPPLNPADRRISWKEAMAWAFATAIGAAVARVVALRAAAAGWEKATGETPPVIAT